MKQLGSKLLVLFVIIMKLSKPLLAILSKLFTVFIKLFKGAASTKLILGASTFGLYSVLISWQFALCLMLLIGIHESGHVWAMRRMGMATRGFYFIPFFGGMAVSDSNFPSAYAEWYVAIMGPIWGLGVTLATLAVYVFTDIRVFEVAACWMAFVNLINLIPMHPLDGGRVIRAASQSLLGKYSAYVVIAISAPLIAFATIKGYLLFTFFGIMGILEELGQRRELRNREQSFDIRPYLKSQKESIQKFLSDLAVAIGLPADARPDAIQIQFKKWIKRNGLRRIVSELREIRRDYAVFDQKYAKTLPISGRLPFPFQSKGPYSNLPTGIFTATSAEKIDMAIETFADSTRNCEDKKRRHRALQLLHQFKPLRLRMLAITPQAQELLERLTPITPPIDPAWCLSLPEQVAEKDKLNAEKTRILLFHNDSAQHYNPHDPWHCDLHEDLNPATRKHLKQQHRYFRCFLGTCDYDGDASNTIHEHKPSLLFSTLNPITFALCLIDPDFLQKKYLEKLYALTPPSELAMSRKTTILTFAAYAALTALFFFLMALTGGHEAAQGAISFFSAF